MAVTLNASQVPIPTWYTAAATLAAAYSGSAPVFPGNDKSILTAMTTDVPRNINRNTAAMELIARFGGGAFAVLDGLVPGIGTGLQVTFTAGRYLCDGVQELAASTKAVTPNVTLGSIWGSNVGVLSAQTNLTPPAGSQTLLCLYTSNGTDVTFVDTSGVMYLRNGIPERLTADLGDLGDAPGANTRFFTITPGGTYYWNGIVHSRLGDGLSPVLSTIGAGRSVFIPDGMQQIVIGDTDTPFEVLGTLEVMGRLEVISP